MKIFLNSRTYMGKIHKSKKYINEINENDNVKRAMKAKFYQRGDILLVDFGSEMDLCLTAGIRPAICVSSTVFNETAPVMTVVPMTKHFKHMHMASHVVIDQADCIGLWKSGMAMCEQLRCIDRSQAIRRIACIKERKLIRKINLAIIMHFEVNVSDDKEYGVDLNII